MKDTYRRAAVILGGAALLAIAAPTIAEAGKKAEEILVVNADDQPVPIKAIGTTVISGAVSITGKPNVAVPDGVAITGKPNVAVPDGVAITGKPTVKVDDTTPVAVTTAGPQRVVLSVGVGAGPAESEQCDTLPDPPAGKQYVIDAFQLELSTDATPVGRSGYVRDVESNGGSSLFRFTGDWLNRGSKYSARIEGPFVHNGTSHIVAACASGVGAPSTVEVRGVAVGTVEPVS